MYFEKMQQLNYNFPGIPELEMQDIFSRVKFTDKTLADAKNFEEFSVPEGARPDDVARIFYGSSNYWWLVLLSNNIVDVQTEWPKSQSQIKSLFNNFLNGDSYFVLEDLVIGPGDIVVKRDTGKTGGIDIDHFGVVDSYDKIFHRIDVKQKKGTISTGDEICAFGLDGQGQWTNPLTEGFGETGCFRQNVTATGCTVFTAPDSDAAPLCATAGATFAKVQKKTSIKEAVSRFSYRTGELVNDLNPYTNDGLTADYFQFRNMCGLTGTLLYKYMTGASLPEAVSIVTVEEEIVYDNDRSRTIKLLSPNLAGQVSSEITTLLKGNVPRGTTKIITYS
jgi:hypothetical protein